MRGRTRVGSRGQTDGRLGPGADGRSIARPPGATALPLAAADAADAPGPGWIGIGGLHAHRVRRRASVVLAAQLAGAAARLAAIGRHLAGRAGHAADAVAAGHPDLATAPANLFGSAAGAGRASRSAAVATGLSLDPAPDT